MAKKNFLMFDERKFIIVLDDAELSTLFYTSQQENKDGVASRKLLQNAEQLEQSDPLFQNLEKYNSGDILVQNPYNPSTYFDASDAIKVTIETAQIRYLNLASLCQILGCKSFKIMRVEVKSFDNSFAGSVDFNNPEVKAKFELSNASRSKVESTFKCDESYAFNKPDPKKAEEFIKENFMTNEIIASILVKDARSGYHRKSSNHKFFVSSEFQRTMKFIGAFEMPKFLITCNLNFEMMKKESYLYEIEINIEFHTDLERLNEGAVSRLIESLKRHGVRDEVIREVVSEVT